MSRLTDIEINHTIFATNKNVLCKVKDGQYSIVATIHDERYSDLLAASVISHSALIESNLRLQQLLAIIETSVKPDEMLALALQNVIANSDLAIRAARDGIMSVRSETKPKGT